MAGSYSPLLQGEAEVHNTHQTAYPKSPKKRCALKATRFLSKVAFAGFALTVFAFAALHLRTPRAVHLSPFEMAPIRACPSFFESAEINAPYPSADFVSVHSVSRKEAIQMRTKSYQLGYNVSLFNDDLSPKSHFKAFHFDPVEPFTIHFESTSPVVFFVRHETGFRHYDHRYKHQRERHERHDNRKNSEHNNAHEDSSPVAPVEDRAHHPAPIHRGQIRHPHLNQGKYILVVTLAPNSTADAHVNIRIEAKITTLVFKDCPFASSLKEGHSVVHFDKKKHERHVIAASPNSPTGTVVFVKLIPRAHKFSVVGLSFLAAWAVFRLINRFLRCHSKRACTRNQTNNGERRPCVWSRIFRRRQQQPQVVEFQAVSSPQVQVVSAPVFYAPQI